MEFKHKVEMVYKIYRRTEDGLLKEFYTDHSDYPYRQVTIFSEYKTSDDAIIALKDAVVEHMSYLNGAVIVQEANVVI